MLAPLFEPPQLVGREWRVIYLVFHGLMTVHWVTSKLFWVGPGHISVHSWRWYQKSIEKHGCKKHWQKGSINAEVGEFEKVS